MTGASLDDSAPFDLLVHGGLVVTGRQTERLDVGIRGGLIAQVAERGALSERSASTIDAQGMLVLPGAIDPHCHYSTQFGVVFAESQDYSHAAALGGNTTIIDFAFQFPPQTLREAIDAKKAEANGRMAVDYSIHGVVTGEISFDTIAEIGDVIADGIPTIKTLTTYDHLMSDDGHRWGVMNAIAEHGGMNLVHAEDDAIARWLEKKFMREGKTHGAYVAETRPSLVEEAAIRRVALLAERSGSALYVLHMAAGSGVNALAEGRARGLPFYGETLTPYLSFTHEALWDDERRGLLWNNFPTIKTAEDQETLWAALADNRLQVVSSDHFAVSVADRYERMGTTIDSMQAGQAGVELRVPVLFHLGVQHERISLNRFVELVATNPAKLMGLYPRKGAVLPGSDADLIIIDPTRTWTVRHEDLHMSSDYSCWEGWELRGRIMTTISRGVVIVRDGEFVGSMAHGEFLPRKLDPALITCPIDPTQTYDSSQKEAEAVALAFASPPEGRQ
jgi:dihydropyrimidinase